MGFSDFKGEPLTWPEIRRHTNLLRNRGLQQFVNLYKKIKDRDGDEFLWGDELEHFLVNFNHEKRKVQLVFRGDALCQQMQEEDPNSAHGLWHEEHARFMLESMPAKPYGSALEEIKKLETSMIQRRQAVKKFLLDGEHIVTMASFPRLGCTAFSLPEYDMSELESNPLTLSSFIPDQAVTKKVRCILMSRNLRQRKGRKAEIKIPLYRDVNTSVAVEPPQKRRNGTQRMLDDQIYMDSSVFGGGSCAAQVTIQAQNLTQGRFLHDQLAVLAPLLLALSAASPILKGLLSDTDVRWKVIEQAVDDRTDEEKRCAGKRARWSSIAGYLSPESKKFNDVSIAFDKDVKSRLQNCGVDARFAEFIAHIWIRDPILVCSGDLESFDPKKSDIFEMIYTSVWPTVRLKFPDEKASCGWRVEFRACEAQLTDFENAAYLAFVVLLSKVILAHKMDLLMPISMIDENMDEAHKRDAARRSKFWFKSAIPSFDLDNGLMHESNNKSYTPEDITYERMSLDTIMNGKMGGFPGLLPMIRKYVQEANTDDATRNIISAYLALLGGRASGRYLTAAQWIREFVHSHPEYRKDSIVSDSATYDLVMKCDQLARGEIECPKLSPGREQLPVPAMLRSGPGAPKLAEPNSMLSPVHDEITLQAVI